MTLVRDLLLCSVVVPSLAYAQAPARDFGPKIDAIVQKAVEAGAVPGVQVAVSVKGKVVFEKGYGFADLESETKVTPQALFRIGSVTKQFTAASILKLAEEGKLAVGDLVEKYVPEFDFQGRKVTIEHLLHHTSGLPNYTDLGAEWDKTVRTDYSPIDLVKTLVEGKPYLFEPGERWEYCNTGYVLLGAILEKLSGQSYGDYVVQDLLKGQGLSSIRHDDPNAIIKNRAQGYTPGANGPANDPLFSTTHPHAAGALLSTASDLVRWTDALAHGRIVSAKSYEYMTTVGALNDGTATTYGGGLMMGKLEDEPMISHSGGIFGFQSMLSYYPQTETAIAVLVNSDAGGAGRLEIDIARAVLDMKVKELLDLPIDDDQLDRMIGRYEGILKVTIRRKGDQLFLQGDGQGEIRLQHQGDLVFGAPFDPTMRVTFEQKGEVSESFLLHQGGADLSFKRVK